MPAGQNYAATSYYVDLSGDGGFCKSADFPTYTSLEVETGLGMSHAFYEWIAKSMERGGAQKAGSVASLGYNNKIVFKDAFQSALVSEVTFPALDAASKDAAYLNVTFQVSGVSVDYGASGQSLQVSGIHLQKRWLRQDFCLKMDKADCSHVMTVGELVFTPRPNVPSLSDGDAKRKSQSGDKYGCSGTDLVITTKEAHAAGLRQFCASGNSTGGSLHYLGANLAGSYLTLEFTGLAGKSIDPPFPLNPAATVTITLRYSSVRLTVGTF
jgi:hypothetical protein